jgi:hypothetical protein
MFSELWPTVPEMTPAVRDSAWRDIVATAERTFRAAVIVENPWSSWFSGPPAPPDRKFYYIADTRTAMSRYGRSTRQKLAQVERRQIEVRRIHSIEDYGFKKAFVSYYQSRGYKLKPEFFWEVVRETIGKDFHGTVAVRKGELVAGTLSANLRAGTMAEGSFLVRRNKECSVGMAAVIDHSIRHAMNGVYILGSNPLALKGVSYFKRDFGCSEIPIQYLTLGKPVPRRELSVLMDSFPYFYFYPVEKSVDGA